jgi:Flp pilus assembly pilin Flp
VAQALTRIRNLLTAEDGQALAEFGFILMLIAVVCVVALGLLGSAVVRPFFDFLAETGFGAGS